MTLLSSFWALWAQIPLPGVSPQIRPLVIWLFLLGEPSLSIPGILGGLLSWLKIVSLLSLIGWMVSWLAAALKERVGAKANWLDIAALVALIASPGVALIRVLETTERLPVYKIGGVYLVTLFGLACGAVIFLWVEAALWRTIRRHRRSADLVVLFGIHLALVLGIFVEFLYLKGLAPLQAEMTGQPQSVTWQDSLVFGARLSATYMGYVVFLRVLWLVAVELFAVKPRRLYAIARLCVIESNRRMWAPWVVITVFLVILAFTHWFLQAPRAAEMGRLFVGTLSLLCSLLLLVMVTILTPLSLPHDIQYQTIYTVVSKPVRRIELVWGRMLGFMALVTVLIVVFYGISLLYLWRTVGGEISATEQKAVREAQAGRLTQANQLREQADQLRTRMAARVPIYGSLSFLDSLGKPHFRGIDVGAEQGREPRSHIEGATPATAIWTFGHNIPVPDPMNPQQRRILIDRPLPVGDLLADDTVEGLLDKMYVLQYQIAASEQMRQDPRLPPDRVRQLASGATRNREELQRVSSAYEKIKKDADELEARANALPADRAGEADRLRRQAASLHSPPVLLEMTFNVYRTTKGKLGEAVYAELEVTNPATETKYRNIFPIKEYYTNKQTIPSKVLAGSRGALKIEVRCLSPTQYLGMAESDLFLLSRSGNFGLNFLKGLFGVWLQAMVLTAIGVFAGTFLSWPVALLTTLAFFVAGQVAFSFLLEMTGQGMPGGGPFESLIRLLTHDNQVSELSPTLAVVTAKTLDSLVMPVMSRLVFVVPNFSALDVSDNVANGFDVSRLAIVVNSLLALGYALPFSIAGYFILKNREVAA
jgi:hypothetical protein